MAVRSHNPFEESQNNPFEQKSNPFEGIVGVIRCPVCQEKDADKLDNRNTPYQVIRICKTCGNQWSCGNAGGFPGIAQRALEAPPEGSFDPEPAWPQTDAFRTRSFDIGEDY
jgi:hypothetical protein